MTLTREAILTKRPVRMQAVEIPEWGGTVHVRVLTGRERDAWEEECANAKGSLANIRARLAVRVCCDDQGNALFKPADAADLGQQDGAALARIFDVAIKINRMTKADIDELVGNSGSGPAAASPSSSPSPSA